MSDALQKLETSEVRRFKPYPAYKASGTKWLGNVPEHWSVKRGRFCMSVNPPLRLNVKLGADDEVSFVPMEAVGEYGGLDLSQTRMLGEISSGYTEFKNGDVIVAKITPCFENGKGALARGLLHGVAYGTTELHVLRSGEGLERRYLFYVTISSMYRKAGEAEMYGAGGQKRVPPEFNKDFRTPLPPNQEQLAICDFLDIETSKIDTLIAHKRGVIEKLKEKRSALISRTVMRGLPPEAAHTRGLSPHPPLKPSGVEWLGDVPTHWNVLPFTKYVAEKSDYRGATPEKVHEGIFLVTAKNVRMGFIDYESSQEYVAAEDYDQIMRRGFPKKGDILFTTEAPLGNVALVDREDIALAQRIIRFRMNPEYFDSRFTLYAMMSNYFQGQLQSLSTGSTAEGLKASKLPILRLIAPPIDEQRTIAAYLDSQVDSIDQAITVTEQGILRMKEYRTALITAAVTGKIDVRGVVA
jgi:type I restriction enzyme S subunit